MSTMAAKIRAEIKSIGTGNTFTTADLLQCGNRNAVDQQLFELVRRKEIMRMSRGVFVVLAADTEIPTAEEIAKAKARRFGKEVIVEIGNSEMEAGNTVFPTDGCTSSFKTEHGRLYFKNCSPRKLARQKSSTNNPGNKTVRAPLTAIQP